MRRIRLMSIYGSFASVYDAFMDNVPYDRWTRFLIDTLSSYGVTDGLVAELGCGTGIITGKMAQAGYDMIGIDASVEMLETAQDKQITMRDGARASGRSWKDILYICQDMREFELYGTVRAFYSFCDSMNYLLTEEDLLQTFKLVNNYLDPGGLFLFDLVTDRYYREIGENTISDTREIGSLIWENDFDEAEHLNTYDVTLYIRDDLDSLDLSEEGRRHAAATQEDVVYRRSHEVHYCRTYSLERIKDLAEKAGLEWVWAIDSRSHERADDSSRRWYILLRECTKQV